MSTNLHASEQPLYKIFSDDFAFEIPPYQRPYAWTTEQAGELLSDLRSFAEMGAGKIEDMRPYFLGSIVLIKADSSKADVVDGQQRLTTLTILLSCLRQLLPAEHAPHVTGFLYAKGNPFTGAQNSYRLRLRPRDADFFQQYIQDENGLGQLMQLDSSKLSDSQKNIQANAQFLLEHLTQSQEADRVRLLEFIMRRCFLVVVSTPDFDSAYRIFSVLNTRGLELGMPDIIKADVIGAIPENLQKQYTDIWEEEENDLGREGFTQLFAHIRSIYVKAKQRDSMLNEFRVAVKPTLDPRGFIDDVLKPYSDALETIRTATYSGPKNVEINDYFRWLNQIANSDWSDWLPPALVFFSKNENKADKLAQFFSDLDRLTASLYIRRADVNERIERYGRLLQWLEKGQDVFQINSPLQLTSGEKSATERELMGDIYWVRRTRLYILLRLDAALSAGGAIYSHSIISVEHVLPQNPAPGSNWVRDFPTQDIRDAWVHKLANLVLLTKKKNSQAQNFDFDPKKRLYFSGKGGVANFALTNQVLSETVWTPALLDARQKHLASILKTLWRL